MILEGTPYHEGESLCLIHSISALSRGRKYFYRFGHRDGVAKPVGYTRQGQGYFSPNCEIVILVRVDWQGPFLKPAPSLKASFLRLVFTYDLCPTTYRHSKHILHFIYGMGTWLIFFNFALNLAQSLWAVGGCVFI